MLINGSALFELIILINTSALFELIRLINASVLTLVENINQ